MTIHHQLELFPEGEPDSALAAIERRLPKAEWLRVSDVALAFDRCVNTIYGWCDQGLFTVMKCPSTENPSRPIYSIFRPSVIRYAKVCLGIEPPEGKTK